MNTFAACALGLLASFAVSAKDIAIADPARLDLKNVEAEAATFRGAPALKLTGKTPADGIAIVKDISFHNGTIILDVAGAPGKGAFGEARGFIGIVFRMKPDGAHYEQFYIRPTNGRAEDQLRRNHSTQYTSAPDWPWQRLRSETPGLYESYADMAPGEWIRLRIEVKGVKARLFVGEAPQPCLIVNDLKLGDSEGGIGLWIGPGAEGHFRNLQVIAD